MIALMPLAALLLCYAVGQLTLLALAPPLTEARLSTPDSAAYLDAARALLVVGKFSVTREHPDVPQVVRTPGYPVFIAGVWRVFGEGNVVSLILIQIAVSVLTIGLTYTLARKLWSRQIALIAAGYLALDIPSWISAQTILTETMFTGCLTLATLAGVFTLKNVRHAAYWAACYGGCLGIAALIRPIALYLIAPVSLWLVIAWKMNTSWRWKGIGLHLACFLIPWLVCVGGWTLRNYSLTGHIQMSLIQGVNLFFYRGAGIVALRDGLSFEKAQRRLGYERYRTLPPEQSALMAIHHADDWTRDGLALIRRHPLLCLKTQIHGLIKMFGIPGEFSLWRFLDVDYPEGGPAGDLLTLNARQYFNKWIVSHPLYFFVFVGSLGYLLTGYGCAAFAGWRALIDHHQARACHALVWLTLFSLTMLSAGPEAYFRFRVPLMPFLSVYIGAGLYSTVAQNKRRAEAKL